MNIAETMKKIQDLGLTAEDLDELVHDVAAKHASNVNNEGLHGQLEYLGENAWTEEDVVKWLTEGEE